MRIIAGRFKGRRLRAPARGLRPSSDRLRERLFAVLGGELAGTLGIEALSRGAHHLICVDRSAAHLRILAANLAALHCPDLSVEVIRDEACHYVEKRWPKRDVHWVFLDPPYEDPAGARCLDALGRLHAARLDWVIFEGAKAADPAPGLVRERTLEFGGSCLTLLRGALAP